MLDVVGVVVDVLVLVGDVVVLDAVLVVNVVVVVVVVDVVVVLVVDVVVVVVVLVVDVVVVVDVLRPMSGTGTPAAARAGARQPGRDVMTAERQESPHFRHPPSELTLNF